MLALTVAYTPLVHLLQALCKSVDQLLSVESVGLATYVVLEIRGICDKYFFLVFTSLATSSSLRLGTMCFSFTWSCERIVSRS